jgi:Tfp pilus assembly protein PilF
MLSRVLGALIRRPGRSDGAAVEPRWAQDVAKAGEALTAGDLPRAQALLEGALANGCESVKVRRMLGSVLGASGQLERARIELERALQADPRDAAALSDLGNVHRLCERTHEAEACYRRALSHDPVDRTARFNVALIDEQAGRTEAAIGALHALV